MPFAVAASCLELPVASCAPAETVADVASLGFAMTGASPGPVGASTSAFASAGGAPVSAGCARAVVACKMSASTNREIERLRIKRNLRPFEARTLQEGALLGKRLGQARQAEPAALGARHERLRAVARHGDLVLVPQRNEVHFFAHARLNLGINRTPEGRVGLAVARVQPLVEDRVAHTTSVRTIRRRERPTKKVP